MTKKDSPHLSFPFIDVLVFSTNHNELLAEKPSLIENFKFTINSYLGKEKSAVDISHYLEVVGIRDSKAVVEYYTRTST